HHRPAGRRARHHRGHPEGAPRPGRPGRRDEGRRAERSRHAMISDIFVDRPRLAVVIAVVTTLAGAIALTAIPIAQFPEIVPPQVQVTTSYPGAGADVVEA